MEESKNSENTMCTTPIPYNLTNLLKRRPHTADKSKWTKDQKHVVSTLLDCWGNCKFWVWGDEEDWALLEPLFDHNGEYLG